MVDVEKSTKEMCVPLWWKWAKTFKMWSEKNLRKHTPHINHWIYSELDNSIKEQVDKNKFCAILADKRQDLSNRIGLQLSIVTHYGFKAGWEVNEDSIVVIL